MDLHGHSSFAQDIHKLWPFARDISNGSIKVSTKVLQRLTKVMQHLSTAPRPGCFQLYSTKENSFLAVNKIICRNRCYRRKFDLLCHQQRAKLAAGSAYFFGLCSSVFRPLPYYQNSFPNLPTPTVRLKINFVNN